MIPPCKNPILFDIRPKTGYNGCVYHNERKECPQLGHFPIERNENMDFLKKNPYPLAAYCFGLYSVLQVFSAGNIVSTLNLLAYIFLTVMLFMKRRDILMVAAAAVPSVINLLSILIYGTNFLGFLSFLLNVLSIGGSLLLCCWMVWPDGLPE